MKLILITTYDENGKESEPTLKYWDEDAEAWEDVFSVRCSEKTYRKNIKNPNWLNWVKEIVV